LARGSELEFIAAACFRHDRLERWLAPAPARSHPRGRPVSEVSDSCGSSLPSSNSHFFPANKTRIDRCGQALLSGTGEGGGIGRLLPLISSLKLWYAGTIQWNRANRRGWTRRPAGGGAAVGRGRVSWRRWMHLARGLGRVLNFPWRWCPVAPLSPWNTVIPSDVVNFSQNNMRPTELDHGCVRDTKHALRCWSSAEFCT